jgi:thymidylate synthase (FAD)
MELYRDFLEYSDSLYFRLMDLGVAPEQARLVLPYATMTRWRWTCSLQAALNFVQLRLGHGAQQEITYYAQEVQSILKEHFPVTLDAWTTYR